MDTQTYFSQSTKKAVGVIFAEATDEHPALAVMLQETRGAFCDSLGLENGTSQDISAFDGHTNTIAMFQSKLKKTGKGCPIAETMFHFHSGGQSDYIPSVAEQRLLVKSAAYINGIIEKLGGIPIDNLYRGQGESRLSGMVMLHYRWRYYRDTKDRDS